MSHLKDNKECEQHHRIDDCPTVAELEVWEEQFNKKFDQWRYKKWSMWWIDDMPEADLKDFIRTLITKPSRKRMRKTVIATLEPQL